MGAIRNLKPDETLTSQLEFLYGNETGWVYSPTKDLTLEGKHDKDGDWTPHHFAWPREKDKLVQHVISNRDDFDVYISPVLFKDKGGTKASDVKGSLCYWAEFDGKVPTESELREQNIPLPSLRIQSSVDGYEHWYWRSPNLITDLADLQDINKGLVYALGGDLSCWYAHKVLRPVSGINHKRDHEEVAILSKTSKFYASTAFKDVPVPQTQFSASNFNPMLVPSATSIIAKYSFTDADVVDLLFKPPAKFKEQKIRRSEALTRLGFECAEMGMTNEEIYSLVEWMDRKLRKYADRHDSVEQYIRLVDYIRNKKPKTDKKLEDNSTILQTKGWRTFLNTAQSLEYVVDGLIPRRSNMYLVGPPGSGKTMLAIELCKHLAMNKEMFGWKNALGRSVKILYLSLEMPEDQTKEFLEKFTPKNESDLDLLEENFQIFAESTEPLEFWNPQDSMVMKFVLKVNEFRPDIVLIDSATVSLAPSLTDEVVVKKTLKWFKQLRNGLDFSVIYISHTVKDQNRSSTTASRKRLDDMFGSRAISADAISVMCMVRDEEKPGLYATVSYLKTRFSSNNGDVFDIVFDDNIKSFTRPVFAMNATGVGTQEVPSPRSPVAEEKPKSGGGFNAGSF